VDAVAFSLILNFRFLFGLSYCPAFLGLILPEKGPGADAVLLSTYLEFVFLHGVYPVIFCLGFFRLVEPIDWPLWPPSSMLIGTPLVDQGISSLDAVWFWGILKFKAGWPLEIWNLLPMETPKLPMLAESIDPLELTLEQSVGFLGRVKVNLELPDWFDSGPKLPVLWCYPTSLIRLLVRLTTIASLLDVSELPLIRTFCLFS